MKYFIDGDQMCFTKDDFVNLQESPAVFVPLENEDVQQIIAGDALYMASGAFLVDIGERLKVGRHDHP